MVFLTMLPEEFEHTREPSYGGDVRWPPLFQLQTLSSLGPCSEEFEAAAVGGSQDSSNIGSSVSSRDTTPPPEEETQQESITDKIETKPKIVNLALSMQEQPTFEEDLSHPEQTPSIADSTALERTTAEADLKLAAASESPEQALTPIVPVQNGQECSAFEILPKTPPFPVSCPAKVSPTDPPSTRLRHMIANCPSIITCPGVYDGLSARIALQVGFKGLYMTGAGTTASCLGASDLGIAHLHEMRTNAEMIANLSPDGPPLIADMDTGYGGPLIISRAVKQYARAGVAAFHIEDQVPEKRCGHLSGKEVVDTETYLRRIRACLDARAQIRSDIVIIARTDALQSQGYDACIDRLRRARALGADMGILEGVASKADAARAVKDLAPWPLCYNSVENGHSPLITASEAQEMGYRVMIFSFAGIAPAYMAIMETFTKLKDQGVTGSIVGPKTIFEVCGLHEEMRIDEACGGRAFAKGI